MGAESLAWTLMFLLMPLTCVYYPVAVLPDWLQSVAWALPPTYVFEGMRALVIEHVFRADLMLAALRAQRRSISPPRVVAFLELLRERPPRSARCCRPANRARCPSGYMQLRAKATCRNVISRVTMANNPAMLTL